MAAHVVARATEIAPGGRKIVEVAGRSIGIFNVRGEYFAVSNKCPHAGGPLCEGDVGGLTTSTEPGEFFYSRAGEFVRCPWHSWEFDLRTGQSWFDPRRVRVRAFEASVVSGAELSKCSAPPGDGDRAAGPFTAEVFPVSVEDNYVVLHL